jgi:hypothetical protein
MSNTDNDCIHLHQFKTWPDAVCKVSYLCSNRTYPRSLKKCAMEGVSSQRSMEKKVPAAQHQMQALELHECEQKALLCAGTMYRTKEIVSRKGRKHERDTTATMSGTRCCEKCQTENRENNASCLLNAMPFKMRPPAVVSFHLNVVPPLSRLRNLVLILLFP